MTGDLITNSSSFNMATIVQPLSCHPDEGGISSKYPMKSFTLKTGVFNFFNEARVQDVREVVD